MRRGVSSLAEVPQTSSAATIDVEALFEAQFNNTYRLVGRLLGPGAQPADIEDVTQQVFLAAHRAAPKFRGHSKPSTWLYGLTTRVVMNSLRGFSRRRRLQKMLETELPLAHLGAHDRGSPERSAEARDELLRVWRALMKVSTKKRVVYILHALEGQSGEEIAAALEIPVATVWTRLHHARKELLGRLE